MTTYLNAVRVPLQLLNLGDLKFQDLDLIGPLRLREEKERERFRKETELLKEWKHMWDLQREVYFTWC